MFQLKKARGVIPPLVTPFNKDGSLDEENLSKLVRFLCQHVHGLFICGTYGSGPLMNVDERKRVAEIVAENRLPETQFIVHVGTTNVRDTVELARHAEAIGAEKVASVIPYYFHHNNESIRLYFDRLVNSVNIPVYLYNNPKLTGVAVDIPLAQELADAGVVGVKDSSFSIMVLADFIRKIDKKDFDVVLGTEAMFLPASALGVQAFIPGLGNAFPELCVELFDAVMSGEQQKARRLQMKVNTVRDIMYLAKSTVVAAYALLEFRGICKAYAREPFAPLSEDESRAIGEQLVKLELI